VFLFSLVCYPELLDDLIHHINYFTYLMVAFSAGTDNVVCYFVYRLITDNAVNRSWTHSGS